VRAGLSVALALMVAISLVVGCGTKHTYVAPGGKITVDKKKGKTTAVEVETAKGKAKVEVEKKTSTEAELGVPVYPGAKSELSGQYEGQESGNTSIQQNVLSTSDDFDKVVEFYKSKLKNVKNTVNQSAGDQKIAIFQLTKENGAETTVQIATDKQKNRTIIHIITANKPNK